MFSLFLEVLFLAKYETNDVPWCHFKLSFIYAPYNVLPIQGLSNNRIIMKVYFDHTSRPANYNGTQMTDKEYYKTVLFNFLSQNQLFH